MKHILAIIASFLMASCHPAYANPSPEDDAFCEFTGHVAVAGMGMRQQGRTEAQLTEDAEEIIKVLGDAITNRQQDAIRRAIRFGFFSTVGENPNHVGRWQYVGCLAVEI